MLHPNPITKVHGLSQTRRKVGVTTKPEQTTQPPMESVRTPIQHTLVSLQKRFSPTTNGFLCPTTTLAIPNPSTTWPKPLPSLCVSLRSPSTDHATLLVDTFSHHRSFRALLKRLSRQNSCPLRLLGEDGDWTKEHFWAVVRFLRHTARAQEVLQVCVCVSTVLLHYICLVFCLREFVI